MLVGICLIFSACSDDQEDADPAGTTAKPSPDAGRWFTCTDETLRFRIDDFDGPANEEDADTPTGRAIRAQIRKHNAQAHPADIPLHGWQLLTNENGQMLFGSGRPEQFAFIVLRRDSSNGELEADASGPACLSYAVNRHRLLSASWIRQGNESAETMKFVALVNERACTGGADPTDRLVGPEIDYRDDSVVVTFFVRPLPPLPPDAAYGCPGPPPTPVPVTLSEPLGNRKLLDGGTYPAREPVAPTDV